MSEYVQIAAIRGNWDNISSTKMFKDDFYTLLIKNSHVNKGIRKDSNSMISFEFNTITEQDNFINYINTDFSRFALSLLKNSQNTSRGEMSLIPWLDFTQEWNDEKLFEHFNINKETQEYIRNFLPDFYNIRND